MILFLFMLSLMSTIPANVAALKLHKHPTDMATYKRQLRQRGLLAPGKRFHQEQRPARHFSSKKALVYMQYAYSATTVEEHTTRDSKQLHESDKTLREQHLTASHSGPYQRHSSDQELAQHEFWTRNLGNPSSLDGPPSPSSSRKEVLMRRRDIPSSQEMSTSFATSSSPTVSASLDASISLSPVSSTILASSSNKASTHVPTNLDSSHSSSQLPSLPASPTASDVLPSGVVDPPQADQLIRLEDRFGIAYTVDALIGDNKTPVPVLVDTGSATFWIAAQECNQCADAKMTTSISMNPQCVTGQETTKLFYGKGQVAGCAANTSIGLGDLNLTNFPVVGVVSIDEDTASLGDVYSGMWGLASSSLNDLGDTPVDIWFKQGLINSPEVGFYFVRDEDQGESEIVIGDALNVDELPFPINVDHKVTLERMGEDSGHYSIKLDTMQVRGLNVEGLQGTKVIVDTGTTMFIVPQSLQRPIFGLLGNGTTIQHPDSKAFVVPCGLMAPTDVAMTLVLGGLEFPVQFRDLVGEAVEDYPGFCYGALMSLDDELVLLGGTFLVNVYHTVNPQTGQVTVFGLK